MTTSNPGSVAGTRQAPDTRPAPIPRTTSRHRNLVGPTAAVLIASLVGGAAIGAATAPKPNDRYAAEAVVLVPPSASPRLQERQLRRLATILTLPQATDLARQAIGAPASVQPRVSVTLRPAASALTIRVRDESPDRVLLFANALAAQGLGYSDVLRALASGTLPLGDFVNGIGPWQPGPRSFATPPLTTRVVTDAGRFNKATLVSTCARVRACGASRLVYYPFRTGVRYTIAGWVRSSTPGIALDAHFGVPVDQSVSRVILRRAWQRIALDWVPVTDQPVAEIAFTMSPSRKTAFALEGVWMADNSALQNAGRPFPNRSGERALFRRHGSPYTLPAVTTEPSKIPTLHGAFVGSVYGLAIGSTLLVFALLVLITKRSR
jgi:hypothetical protein